MNRCFICGKFCRRNKAWLNYPLYECYECAVAFSYLPYEPKISPGATTRFWQEHPSFTYVDHAVEYMPCPA